MYLRPSLKWQFSSRVLLPILAACLAVVAVLTAIFLYATRESDRIARQREGELVTHVLTEQFARITHDQQSVTTWDEAIRQTTGSLDLDWMDLNLGIWMHEYFGHDRTYVLNSRDQSIYAMHDGARVDPSYFVTARTAVSPLIDALRSRRVSAEPDDAETISVADLVVILARPAIASVVPIVSDTGALPQTPGSEAVHVSIRFLDGSFLDWLMRQYLFRAARFAWNDDAGSHEAALPIKTKSGTALGYFIWQPDRPGWRLLTQTAPVILAALLLVAAVIALLVRQLRRASKELQASEAQAHHLAFHDSLTGLPNRALFNDQLDRALAEARRSSSHLAVLCLDLDRFKNVNDTLGHTAGDHLIRELGRRLVELVRDRDCVARLGGDEFVILQTGVTGTGDVAALCERVIQAVSQPFKLLGNSTFVGVSIGVALAPEDGTDRAELIRKADIALYCAKSTGRNRFRVFSEEMDNSIQRRREIEREMREALLYGDQFFLDYQPLYGKGAAEINGIEALLRWKHPKHGIVAPGSFVSIAEESGLILPLGEWVLREACKAGVRWPMIPRIAINISPIQFRSPGFGLKVLTILGETGLEPARLELEITESVLLESQDTSTLTLQTLREAGVTIAIDDFGTGYSSLSYLQKFSIDRIKIDRSFVQNLGSASPSEPIITAIMDLARAVGVDVTAEGVETCEQRDFLTSVECNELQGFLLSDPLSADQIDQLVAPATVAA